VESSTDPRSAGRERSLVDATDEAGSTTVAVRGATLPGNAEISNMKRRERRVLK